MCNNLLPIPNRTSDLFTWKLNQFKPWVNFISIWKFSILLGKFETRFGLGCQDRLFLQTTVNVLLPAKEALPQFQQQNAHHDLDNFNFVQLVSGEKMRSQRDKCFDKNSLCPTKRICAAFCPCYFLLRRLIAESLTLTKELIFINKRCSSKAAYKFS